MTNTPKTTIDYFDDRLSDRLVGRTLALLAEMGSITPGRPADQQKCRSLENHWTELRATAQIECREMELDHVSWRKSVQASPEFKNWDKARKAWPSETERLKKSSYDARRYKSEKQGTWDRDRLSLRVNKLYLMLRECHERPEEHSQDEVDRIISQLASALTARRAASPALPANEEHRTHELGGVLNRLYKDVGIQNVLAATLYWREASTSPVEPADDGMALDVDRVLDDALEDAQSASGEVYDGASEYWAARERVEERRYRARLATWRNR